SRMPGMRVVPEAISYNAAISACEKGGQWQLSLLLLTELQVAKLAPTEVSYSAALSSCGQAGAWEPALVILETLLRKRFTPTSLQAGSIAASLRSGPGIGAAFDFLGEMLRLWIEQEKLNSDITLVPSLNPEGSSMLTVLCQQPGVLAISKPAGMTTEDAVIGVSQQLAREMQMSAPADLHIASRLDHPTSGVLPVALGAPASAPAKWLEAQFAGRLVGKEYLCLCEGASLGSVGSQGNISVALRVRCRPTSLHLLGSPC
ncbi:unnamed protein product, partial [Polarella glacialis]